MSAKYQVIGLNEHPDDGVALSIAEQAAKEIERSGFSIQAIRGVHAFDVEFNRELRLSSVIFMDESGELAQVDLNFAGDAPEDAVDLMVEKARSAP